MLFTCGGKRLRECVKTDLTRKASSGLVRTSFARRAASAVGANEGVM